MITAPQWTNSNRTLIRAVKDGKEVWIPPDPKIETTPHLSKQAPLSQTHWRLRLRLAARRGALTDGNTEPGMNFSKRLDDLHLWHLMRKHRGHLNIGKRPVIARGAILDPTQGKIVIGKRARIGHGAMLLSQGGVITLGDNCSVNPYSVLYGHGGLTIGNWVRIATHVVIVPSSHVFEDPSLPIKQQGITTAGITIEDDVWIGANVSVLDGVHISRGCVIGAGSVVRSRTEPYGIYVGAPARLVRFRGEAKVA